MNYIIFDIDGTLIQSTGFDTSCFKRAILEHADVVFRDDWGEYKHVTDSGILKEIIESHGLAANQAELNSRIKQSFINNIAEHLTINTVDQVPGANQFLSILNSDKNIRLAIATGGWGETAKLKLKSAGINFDGIPLCSANDAISRVDIMNIALSKAGQAKASSVSYFGDASWDKKACADLNWNFILVGDRTEHHQKIDHFNQVTEALKLCTL